MAKAKDLILKIGAYAPETMPMSRLAEYMTDLAMLLGEKESVHFLCLDEGSTALVHRIDQEAVPKVEERLRQVQTGDAPNEARRAAALIDRRLAADNATGVLKEVGGADLLPFPGVDRFLEPEFGPFNEPGSLDGVVNRVGGQRQRVPIHLETRTGFETHCEATREVAKELAKLMFGPEIRCIGVGRWHRDGAGIWEMRKFTISEFFILDGRPLPEIVSDLQAVQGNGWRAIADPWAALAEIRPESETTP
ncbi:MAG: hypothetical protein OXF26_01425 [Alphaproteobacteria bacterium]|nr:hypothetical protein [Alphaproteobacteria bacterium]